jgi:hypothetical protein
VKSHGRKKKKLKAIGDWELNLAAEFGSSRRLDWAREKIGYQFRLLLERYFCGLLIKLVFDVSFGHSWTYSYAGYIIYFFLYFHFSKWMILIR